MRFNQMGNILIAEDEVELIWFALGEWYCEEQVKIFNKAYDKWMENGGRGVFRVADYVVDNRLI
jgi:hypothetical protein